MKTKVSQHEYPGGWREWEDVGKRVRTSSYKMSKFPGDLMYSIVTA